LPTDVWASLEHFPLTLLPTVSSQLSQLVSLVQIPSWNVVSNVLQALPCLLPRSSSYRSVDIWSSLVEPSQSQPPSADPFPLILSLLLSSIISLPLFQLVSLVQISSWNVVSNVLQALPCLLPRSSSYLSVEIWSSLV
jgi:hypothetical protein